MASRILLRGFSEETMLPAGLLQKWREVVGKNHAVMGRKGYQSKSVFIKVVEDLGNGGVITEGRIPKGEFVGNFGGIMVDAKWYDELNRGVQQHVQKRINALDYGVDDNLVVVAWEAGNWTRHISQSCQPTLKSVLAVGKDRVPVLQLVTTRDVKAGEALTLDYLSQNCHRNLNLVCDCELHESDDEDESQVSVDIEPDVELIEAGAIPVAEEMENANVDAGLDDTENGAVAVNTTSESTLRRSNRLKRVIENPAENMAATVSGNVRKKKAARKSEKETHKSSAKKGKTRNRHGGEERMRLTVNGQQAQLGTAEWVVEVEMEGKTPYRSVKLFDCGVCHKRFNRRRPANIHRATHEGGSYICKTCGSRHLKKQHLEAHQKRWHWEEGGVNVMPKCEVCGLVMTRADVLKRHMVVHAPRIPFSCDQCDATYLRADNLKRHMQGKHRE